MANDDKRSNAVAELAREALEAFKADAPKEYEALVKEYEGRGAIVGVFGMGSVNVAVSGGAVEISEGKPKGKTRMIGRGATYPETILAMSKGEVTPLEAFHAGDLVIQAQSEELHKAFGLMVKFTSAAVGSRQLQGVLGKFRERAGQK